MSRFDKALRAWEEASGILREDDPGAPADPHEVFSQYRREDGLSEHAPAIESRVYGHRAAPLPNVKALLRAARSPDPDTEARLVTGCVNPVSLEQYRRLAAALHDAQSSGGLKTVMLTSAVPHEGKTLTAVNLALTLSESYARRVLLVDADLRFPSVHGLLGISNTSGLVEALAGEQPELLIVEVSQRLHVLTAGMPDATLLAGLSSARMGTLLERFASKFDWVLLDTPPVGLLPDASLLARLAGAVILVIGAGSTPKATVERAVAEIGQDCIIGTVMNRVENHRISERDYYDRYMSGPE